MKKLRLVLFDECNRACEGCCNKDWNLPSLETERDFSGYYVIMLTGGEPMLRPALIKEAVREIRAQTKTSIYLYTAKVDNLFDIATIIDYIDGMTITLHEQKDIEPFIKLVEKFESKLCFKSMRLNIFKGVSLPTLYLPDWKIKKDIEWIKDCPLPKDEVLKRHS